MPACHLSKLVAQSSGLFLDIALFLQPHDCMLLSSTARAFRSVLSSEYLWRHFANSIPGFRGTDSNQLDHLRQLFAMTSRQFFETFRRIQFPLLGWFRLKHSPGPLNGGLYLVRLVQKNRLGHTSQSQELVCQRADCRGSLTDDSYSITYDPALKVMVSRKGLFRHKLRFDSGISMFSGNGLCIELEPLPPLLPPIGTDSGAYLLHKSQIDTCLGLFTAPYGSHGIEILHLSIGKTEDMDTNTDNGVGMKVEDMELRALKVSGDPNVPAGQLSFVINLSTLSDTIMETMHDRRFIVMFPHDSVTPTVLSLEERAPHMALFARGRGQINRNPEVWAPEWVGCTFILYRTPLANNGSQFSLVWDDESHSYFRHGMDFQPFPDSPLFQQSPLSLSS